MQFKDELNPIIWDKDNDNQMRPEVNAKLREIADAFIEYIEIPEEALIDVVVTGSSASYNYNEHSDLDLHIIVDYEKIHEDCPLVEGYLGALKNTFNKEHDIYIKDIPVELYAEKQGQGTVHNGLYSVWKEEWIDRPEKIEPTDNDAAVEAKYQEIKEMVDKCDDSEAATELLEKIYTMRKAGLAEAGEFCTENLAFKKLRNEGCMDKLRQIKKEQIDKQLSLESYNEDLNDVSVEDCLQEFLNYCNAQGYKTFENKGKNFIDIEGYLLQIDCFATLWDENIGPEIGFNFRYKKQSYDSYSYPLEMIKLTDWMDLGKRQDLFKTNLNILISKIEKKINHKNRKNESIKEDKQPSLESYNEENKSGWEKWKSEPHWVKRTSKGSAIIHQRSDGSYVTWACDKGGRQFTKDEIFKTKKAAMKWGEDMIAGLSEDGKREYYAVYAYESKAQQYHYPFNTKEEAEEKFNEIKKYGITGWFGSDTKVREVELVKEIEDSHGNVTITQRYDSFNESLKEKIDKQLSLESYNESNINLKEQIKQLFPWIYSTTIYNIGEVFDDRGFVNLKFEIEGGRSDNEIFIWVFSDNLEIWYTNGEMGGRSQVASIKIDNITRDNFIASVMDLLKLVKPTIEEFYRKEEKQQKEKYSKAKTYDIEDDEKQLYAFISKTLKSIKKQLNKEFSIHQTDNTIYINYDKKPENTVFIEPIEDSTQIIKIGLLGDDNMEITSEELELEDFGKTDINNIVNTIKELFMNKNESIKESEDELDLEEKLIEICKKDGWNHINGRAAEMLEKDTMYIDLYVDEVDIHQIHRKPVTMPLNTEKDLQKILDKIKQLSNKNESIKENKMNEALDLTEKDIEQLTKHFRKTYSAEAVENYIESLKREFDNIKWYKKANWKDAYHFDWEPCSFEEVIEGTTRLRALIFALNTTLRDPRLPQELKGKHFEDGFKAELPWPEEFNFVENKMNEAEGIYKPSLILEAYKKEQEWLKSLELGEDERAPEIMLFIIENDKIKDTKLIKREDVYTYKPEENEYYLDMFRDSGDVLTDYNLEPAQKLVDRWNEFKKEESMENKNEDVATLMDKVDAADAELKELIKSLSLREELESLIEKALEE